MTNQDAVAASGLTSTVLTLSEVLSRFERVHVPRYQRPYSWTSDEVGRLVADLRDAALKRAPYYFMGTIVLASERDRPTEVVDGQQRLATLLILLGALAGQCPAPTAQRIEAAARAPDGGPKVLLRPADRGFFANMIAQAPEKITATLDPHKSLARARKTVDDALVDVTDDLEGGAGALAAFALDRITFNLIETEDYAGAPRLFFVLNDTGADLSAADLVKASLFDRASFSEEEAEDAGRRWDGLLDTMGRRALDEMLSFMPAVVRGAYPNVFGVANHRLLEHVDAAKFLKDDIHRYAEALVSIRNAEVDAGMHSDEVNRRIRCMQMLRMRQWLGPAVAAVAEHQGAPERLLPFFEGLERLSYACFLQIIKPHKHSERFEAVLSARNSVTDLLGPGGALELSAEEKRRMRDAIECPFEPETGRRRIMTLRANAALDPNEALRPTDDATVEHILPLSPTETWIRVFPDEDARSEMTELLGNLTLLTGVQNRKCGAASYPEKRRIYFDWKGAPVRALTRNLRDFPDWTPRALMKRHEDLCRILSEDWRLISSRPG